MCPGTRWKRIHFVVVASIRASVKADHTWAEIILAFDIEREAADQYSNEYFI
jgi:hypothetical protein